MARFYTADTHIGHKRILELCDRPFDNVEEMNEAIIDNINAVANEDDHLFVVGDALMGKLDDSLALVERIKPHTHLIVGNHDRMFIHTGMSEKEHRKALESFKRYHDAGFEIIGYQEYHDIGDHGVKICHFPYEGDSHDEDRYVEARPIDYFGEWLICGHVHNAWTQRGRQINVGVDVRDFTPLHEDEILEIINQGPRDI